MAYFLQRGTSKLCPCTLENTSRRGKLHRAFHRAEALASSACASRPSTFDLLDHAHKGRAHERRELDPFNVSIGAWVTFQTKRRRNYLDKIETHSRFRGVGPARGRPNHAIRDQKQRQETPMLPNDRACGMCEWSSSKLASCDNRWNAPRSREQTCIEDAPQS